MRSLVEWDLVRLASRMDGATWAFLAIRGGLEGYDSRPVHRVAKPGGCVEELRALRRLRELTAKMQEQDDATDCRGESLDLGPRVFHADTAAGRFVRDGYPPPCGLSDGHYGPCAHEDE